VITRVNDHKAQIYNRERWRVAEVNPGDGSVVLDGIDTARRVSVDSVYLRSANPRDGAPALQHAYAATIYQAQGATVDRAHVMADPSMDRQEFYVAASRSREETYFYATPEVQLAREEIAPRSPYLRKGLQHIAEAAERDGAQVAAHDQALRSSLGQLSSPELARRREELRSEASDEQLTEESAQYLQERIAKFRQLPDSGDRDELIDRMRAEREALPEVGHQARAEVAVIEHLLGEREQAALTAARISPPDYITAELGERPSDPAKRGAWDRAVLRIEGYRQQQGIVDRDNALGPRPEKGAQRAAWDTQQRQLRQSQRSLELAIARQRTAEIGIEL
jgi:hypothetical protein